MVGELCEMDHYIDRSMWKVRLESDGGVLVSSLYDVMFEMFINLKLITRYRGDDTCPKFSVRTPGITSEEELYDTLFAAQIPLIALTEAGPHLSVPSCEEDISLLKRELNNTRKICGHDEVFMLSTSDIATIGNVITEEYSYGSEMLSAIVGMAEMSGMFCLESNYYYTSSVSAEHIFEALKLSYVEKSKQCIAMKYLEEFQQW